MPSIERRRRRLLVLRGDHGARVEDVPQDEEDLDDEEDPREHDAGELDAVLQAEGAEEDVTVDGVPRADDHDRHDHRLEQLELVLDVRDRVVQLEVRLPALRLGHAPARQRRVRRRCARQMGSIDVRPLSLLWLSRRRPWQPEGEPHARSRRGGAGGRRCGGGDGGVDGGGVDGGGIDGGGVDGGDPGSDAGGAESSAAAKAFGTVPRLAAGRALYAPEEALVGRLADGVLETYDADDDGAEGGGGR